MIHFTVTYRQALWEYHRYPMSEGFDHLDFDGQTLESAILMLEVSHVLVAVHLEVPMRIHIVVTDPWY